LDLLQSKTVKSKEMAKGVAICNCYTYDLLRLSLFQSNAFFCSTREMRYPSHALARSPQMLTNNFKLGGAKLNSDEGQNLNRRLNGIFNILNSRIQNSLKLPPIYLMDTNFGSPSTIELESNPQIDHCLCKLIPSH
jgi:hypothetical protein